MKNTIKVALLFLSVMAVVSSCKKEDEESTEDINENAALYELTKSDEGYIYFKNGDELPGTSPSPHGSFKLRFNDVAAAALDSTGKLPVGASFPENSLIVKDLYSGGSLNLIAVMQKKPSSSNSANNWVWAEYNPGGEVVYSVSENGAACTSCHSTSSNRDFIKTFDLH